MARLDESSLVHEEYQTPARLETRFRPFRDWHVDRDIEAEIIGLALAQPIDDVLEVGHGTGHFATRLLDAAPHIRLEAIDQSQNMVERARAEGINARHGDVQHLPWEDNRFDLVVANWMLYHVPDLDKALREIRRVLKPDGRLIAATMADGMLSELWEQIDVGDADPEFSFNANTGNEILGRHFSSVTCHDLSGTAEFPSRNDVVEYVRATITRHSYADQVPEFDGAFRATTTNVVFEARP